MRRGRAGSFPYGHTSQVSEVPLNSSPDAGRNVGNLNINGLREPRASRVRTRCRTPKRVGEWCRGDDPSEADDGRNRAQHADDLVDRRTGRESGVNARPVRRQGCVDGDEHAEPNECVGVGIGSRRCRNPHGRHARCYVSRPDDLRLHRRELLGSEQALFLHLGELLELCELILGTRRGR